MRAAHPLLHRGRELAFSAEVGPSASESRPRDDTLHMTSAPALPLLLVPSGTAGARALTRGARAGSHVRVKRGVYVAAADWVQRTEQERHLIRMSAFAHNRPTLVFSHRSAAIAHGLPLVGHTSAEVHVTDRRANGGRSDVGIIRHCVGLGQSDVVWSGGLLVTSVARTLIDLALSEEFREALVPLDAALRSGIERAALDAQLGERGDCRGRARAASVLHFADPRSESPGESVSRAAIHELGFVAPSLQVRHDTSAGRRYIADFEWIDRRMIGEFDGRGKYLKPEHLATMTPGDAVVAEKVREDHLRADGLGFCRWGWDDAWYRVGLRDLLLRAGIPRRPRGS